MTRIEGKRNARCPLLRNHDKYHRHESRLSSLEGKSRRKALLHVPVSRSGKACEMNGGLAKQAC